MPLRLTISCAFLAAMLSATASFARADEPASSTPVQQLTVDELAFVRNHVADWDHREAAEQDRIATNVLRIRSLPPEMKAKFLDRAKRAEAAGLGSVLGSRLEEFWRLRPEERHEVKEGNRLSRAVFAAVYERLPAAARPVLDPGANAQALEMPERMAFAGVLLAQWQRRVGEFLVDHPLLDIEPSRDSPDWFVALRDEIKAKGGANAPRELRVKFAKACAFERVKAAMRSVPAPEPLQTPETHRAHEKALASAIHDAFPVAIDGLSSEVAGVAAGGRDAVVAWCRERAPERANPRNAKLLDTVIAIERSREVLTGGLRMMAEQFQWALLREMKLTDSESEELQRLDPEKAALRVQFLQGLRRRFAGGFGFWQIGRRGGERRLPPGTGMGDDKPSMN